MSNYNRYTLFYGYCINEKFNYINEIEESDEKFWDGIPGFSLNFTNVKVGYKIVKDLLGKEELYFGVELYSFDEYSSLDSMCFNIDDLKHKFVKDISNKYYHLFNEVPDKEFEICFICESV